MTAHTNDLAVVHYTYGHPGDTSGDSARHLWNTIKDRFGPKDFACLDIEITENHDWAYLAGWTTSFDQIFRRISGHTLIGYSNEWFLQQIVKNGAQIAGNRWWIAAYGNKKPNVRGVQTWAWQRTNGQEGPLPHSCIGVGVCDVSILNLATFVRLTTRKKVVK